ncbi:MAG: hypothetical protein DRJ11_09335 [Candidatus Aminicenantes bacterium]|nr:MAG: hypothetical protein DRJ11_09335 [Candidatus Aminicenantes bacterium]
MLRREIVARSPWRILEKAIQGGLKAGEIGALAGRKGVGKTACLVHLATYNLLQEKPVIHVSYARRVDYILTWYEDIFNQIARRRQIPPEKTEELFNSLVRHRVIMNFKHDATQTSKVLQSITAMMSAGDFPAELIIVDGYNFSMGSPEELALFRDFARRVKTSLWFSVSLPPEEPVFEADGWPVHLKAYHQVFDVVLAMRFVSGHVALSVVKNRDFPPAGVLPVGFDPQSLLVVEK